MKKLLYMAAVLAVAAGCSKSEVTPEVAEGFDLNVTVTVKNGLATKAVYDGDQHIKFLKGDSFYAAIAKESTPTTAVKVSTRSTGYASQYYSTFSIVDFEAESPEFKGNFYSIVAADTCSSYKFYGVMPNSAVTSSSSDLTKWRVNLNGSQTATQEYWDSKSDVMLVKPATIVVKNSTVTAYNEMDFADTSGVELAHLFGFGKISFADVPEEYASLPVKYVSIEAVGDKKDICGQFAVNLASEISTESTSAVSTGSTIVVTPESSVNVADNVVWFVANPGVYDVKITVSTSRYDLVFERTGLTVNRSRITSPVVHFKEADDAKSHDVYLAGEKWEQTKFTYYSTLTSSRRTIQWGPDGKQMTFGLVYPGETNTNSGTTYYKADGSYTQGFASSTMTGGVAELYSEASFHGVNFVKLNLGIYTKSAKADFHVCLVNGADTVELQKITIENDENTSNAEGEDYFIENTTSTKDGDFVLRVDGLSAKDIRPYVGAIVLNPDPELRVDASTVKVAKDSTEGSFGCHVYVSKSVPEVSSDADWLTASYADGEVKYSVAANEGMSRTATITVKVTDGEWSATETVTVRQKAAVEVEYKLTVPADTINAAIKALAELHPDASSYDTYELNFTLPAYATDGSGKTYDVPMNINKVYVNSSSIVDGQLKLNYAKLISTSSIGYIKQVVVTSNEKVSRSNYAGLKVCFSSDNNATWNLPEATDITVEGESSPYTSTVVNANEDYTSFKLDTSGGWSSVYIYSYEVTFIGE